MEWISLKDKLPKLNESVLLFDDWVSHRDTNTKHKEVRVGFLEEYTIRKSKIGIVVDCEWKGTEFAFNITHWMPLPEPPKED